MLRVNGCLKSVNLAGNKIGSRGGLALAKMLVGTAGVGGGGVSGGSGGSGSSGGGSGGGNSTVLVTGGNDALTSLDVSENLIDHHAGELARAVVISAERGHLHVFCNVPVAKLRQDSYTELDMTRALVVHTIHTLLRTHTLSHAFVCPSTGRMETGGNLLQQQPGHQWCECRWAQAV
jgi:hypothetical protein